MPHHPAYCGLMSWHLPLLRDPSLQPLLILRQKYLGGVLFEVQYLQEAGRFGRDGVAGGAEVLAGAGDRRVCGEVGADGLRPWR